MLIPTSGVKKPYTSHTPIIPAMPTARSGGQPEEQGPVAHLLRYTQEILELESRLKAARLLRRFFHLGVIFLFLAAVGLYLINVFEWHRGLCKTRHFTR